MSKLRTKREVIDRFEKNQTFKTKAIDTMAEPWFQAWLDATLVNLGPYSVDAPFSNEPHIQDRMDGGKAAINYFIHRLTNLPYKESVSVEDSDEYVGFVVSSSIQTGTNQINKP